MTINATTSLVLRPAHLGIRPARILLRQLPAPVFLKPVQFYSLAILRPRRLVPLCATAHTNTCLYLALSPVCITVSCFHRLFLQICRQYVVRVLAAESIRVTFRNDPVVPTTRNVVVFCSRKLFPDGVQFRREQFVAFGCGSRPFGLRTHPDLSMQFQLLKTLEDTNWLQSNDLIKDLITSASNLPDDQGTKRRRL